MPVNIYDTAVIGAGAAGCMAAIRAGQLGKKVLLIERNNSLGRKILLTGNGRCNPTNTASIEEFIEKFHPNGKFLRNAFSLFFNEELKDFFMAKRLALKEEDSGRLFPVTDRSESVIKVLREYLRENKVDVLYNTRVLGLEFNGQDFLIRSESGRDVKAQTTVIATGGVSYQETGSSGDGFKIARKLGHRVTELIPGLVPLKLENSFVKTLQGLSFERVRISLFANAKSKISDAGGILFTHFGLSGPLALDISAQAAKLIKSHGKLKITIDFKPDLKIEQIETMLAKDILKRGSIQISNNLQNYLPKRMCPIFLTLPGIGLDKRLNQITKKERLNIARALKSFPLTVVGTLGFKQAMVTCGGISLSEIDPRTMSSKIIRGLYFAGEIIDCAGKSGGYNLQQAFSTGYLAGQSA